MRFEDYTKAQQQAIIAKGSNIIVSAGAGSGKTQVLTERVVHFVKDEGYKLNDFLILTFTNLAAGEMKDRIRKALKDKGLEETNKVDFADICTFDSYALSIVKKYHFLLGVSPSVSIIDSNIIDVRKRTIIESLFEKEYEKCSDDFKAMIERFCFKDDDDIRKLLLDFYKKALLEIDTDSFIDSFVDTYYSDEIINFFKKEIINGFFEAREEIAKVVYQLPDEHILSKDERTLLQVYEEYIYPLMQSKTYDEFIQSLADDIDTVKLLAGYKEASKIKSEANKRINELKEYMKNLPENEIAFKEYFISCKGFAEKLINILHELDRQIKDFKNKYQIFEFQDIAKMALELVYKNEEIKNTLRKSYKMIMIDEYQDTSALQEAFISMIEDNNVYMVGDVKQSIYRFRNTRCDIFVNKYRNYKNNNGGIAIDLNTNFRSRKEVLDDINYIFKQLMTEKYGEANYAREHIIEYGNKDYLNAGQKNDCHIDALVYEPVKSDDMAEIESTLIARDIIDKINNKYPVMDYIKDDEGNKKPVLRPCKVSDFCILMDRGNAFETYAKKFNEYKIPLYIENDEDISNNDVVVVLTNILRLIKSINENDYQSKEFIKAYLSVARSFIFEYSDQHLLNICNLGDFQNEPIIANLRSIVLKYNYLSVSNLFEKIIYELDIPHKSILIGNVVKTDKYLNTFLSMFNTMSSLDYSIDDFILFMECIDEYDLKITLSSTGSEIESVKMMNIHKSKGLEFNIVYYSGLKKEFNRMSLREDFGISTKFGLIFPPTDPNKVNILKDLNLKYEINQDISEKIRLFYVALTRTREKMICLIQSDEYVSLFRNLYKKLFNEYIENKKVLKLEKRQAFNVIFEDFKDRSIANTLFKMLVDAIGYDLPFKFRNLSYEEQLNTDLVQIEEWGKEETDYIEKIKKYSFDLLEQFLYPQEAVLQVFKDYVDSKIDLAFFDDTVMELGCEIDDKFYSRLKFDKNGRDITAKETLNLEISQIHLDSENELNPNVNKDCKNLKQALKILSWCEDGQIDIATLEKWCSLFDIEIKSEVLDFITGKKPIPEYFYSDNAIVNPVYEYDEFETKSRFISLVRASFASDRITDKDAFISLLLYFGDIPYQYEIKLAINKLCKQKINIDNFKEAIEYTGYKIRPETLQFLNDVYQGKKETDDIEKFNNEFFYNHFEMTADMLDELEGEENFKCERIMQKIYMFYRNDEINLNKFITLINCFNFELTKEYSILSETNQKSFYPEDIDEIVVEKGEICENPASDKSLFEFLTKYINYRKFNHYVIDLDVKPNVLFGVDCAIDCGKINVQNVNVEFKKIDPFRPSKSIALDANKANLDFGTRLHLAMEIIDFISPDFSLIDSSLEKYVKKFLSCDLCKNLKNGIIYKEHEFFDSIENTQGIIDLFIVYDDHIDIIDYKTKHIDDASYDKQLSIYKKYISRKFNKTVKTFLYSLIDGKYKETTL